jgi:NADPH:quinone reductase-like Zn-dependent oxidoreductase
MSASELIRAVVVDRKVPGGLVIREVPGPRPEPSQALIRVAASSLNRGEVRHAITDGTRDARIGWDFAGVVEKAAASGSDLRAGERVVGLDPLGGWAERIAVPSAFLARIPDRVSFAQAATLPVAGLTALHAISKGGKLRGRRVLINGASGGVGSFACQLAHLEGARVVAAIRDSAQEAFVRRFGVDTIAVGRDLTSASAHGPYHLILESVGGSELAAALGMLASGGTCVVFGASQFAEVTFDAARFYQTGGTTLYGLMLHHEFQRELPGTGLARLVQLVADGKLQPAVEVEASWTEIADVATRLMERRFVGKAVLHI